MSAKDYSRLGAIIFAIVALVQLVRAVSGWPITIGATHSICWPISIGASHSIPLWASWAVCVVAGVLAWLGSLRQRALVFVLDPRSGSRPF